MMKLPVKNCCRLPVNLAGTFFIIFVSVALQDCNPIEKETIPDFVGTTYYVDSSIGRDVNAGTSKDSPWRNITAINNHTFKPGDTILLKAGGIWYGNIGVHGSGTKEKPIVIDQYGEGNKPSIIGQPDQVYFVLSLANVQYWEVNNLDLSSEYSINGIYFHGGKSNKLSHIYIRNCEIHDLTIGGGYSRGNGIRIDGRYFANDVRIENNYIHDLSGDGIMVDGDVSPQQITNLYVAHNTVMNVAGDGIIIRDAVAPLTEYNYVNNCGYMPFESHAGIWCAFTESAVFQYNECCFVRKPANSLDGMAFDADMETNRTIFQYNYSHDNEGGFHLSMNYDKNEIIRYNISQNDKSQLFSGTIPSPDCNVYNNIFYGPATLNWNPPVGGSWRNNIFWSTNSIYVIPATGSNNISWGNATGGMHMDPLLVNPGSGTVRIDLQTREELMGYTLRNESPCVDAGIEVTGNGGKDFWGKTLYKGKPDIGVSEL